MKLTEKQKRFADYYIESANAEDSAKRAGYNARGNTTKLLHNTTISAYIDERLQEMADKRIMKAEETMQLLTSIARNEEKEEVIVFGEGSSEIVKKGMGAKDRLKALELIGKRYAMWTDRQQLDASIGVTIVDDLDD